MTTPSHSTNPARRLANIGLHVADIERSLVFYRDLLGMTVHVDSGWETDPSLLALSATGDAEAIRIVNLVADTRFGGATITLVQLTGLPGEPSVPRFQDPGAIHLAFDVADLDASLATLEASDFAPVAAPGEVKGGGAGHARVAFLRDPDGFFVELVQRLSVPQAPYTPEEGQHG
ncbi:VOC family protein [Streptomyces sp. B21-108]|uniref:VOC family protein n=1 Tax=Streptomyces sp. B21-108 TaxID=3039419 RepID=UPI002FF2BAE0